MVTNGLRLNQPSTLEGRDNFISMLSTRDVIDLRDVSKHTFIQSYLKQLPNHPVGSLNSPAFIINSLNDEIENLSRPKPNDCMPINLSIVYEVRYSTLELDRTSSVDPYLEFFESCKNDVEIDGKIYIHTTPRSVCFEDVSSRGVSQYAYNDIGLCVIVRDVVMHSTLEFVKTM